MVFNALALDEEADVTVPSDEYMPAPVGAFAVR
jgi:hypothetical protein